MLIIPMIGVLIMHDVLQNYVTMKVIVINREGLRGQEEGEVSQLGVHCVVFRATAMQYALFSVRGGEGVTGLHHC